MDGRELFDKYTALRDFSGSEVDEYAQFLETLQSAIGDKLFPLLKKAEDLHEKLGLRDYEVDRIAFEDIIFERF